MSAAAPTLLRLHETDVDAKPADNEEERHPAPPQTEWIKPIRCIRRKGPVPALPRRKFIPVSVNLGIRVTNQYPQDGDSAQGIQKINVLRLGFH